MDGGGGGGADVAGGEQGLEIYIGGTGIHTSRHCNERLEHQLFGGGL